MDKLIDVENEDHDFLFKLVVIGLFYPLFFYNSFKGETGVGKT